MSGPTHNSLIQIRRGARQDDGSFSFSISVHTSSGRTILFDQHDLESDDDDSDIRIERIIPNLGLSRDRNENQSQRGDLNEDNQNDSDNSNNTTDSNIAVRDLIDHSSENYLSDDSIDEQESEHDIMEEQVYDVDFHPEYDEIQEGNSFNIEIPGGARDPGDFRVSIETNGTDDNGDEPMFRNTGLSRLRRRSNSLSSRSRENSSSDDVSQSNSGRAMPRTLQPTMESDRRLRSSTLDSRADNNSYMFVLQSNSGNRTRCLLNLSYLDSYTEPESKLLQKNIHSNKNRLLGYMRECNVGKGFIKEVAFSSDGRLVSSPYGYGIRLLAFDSLCNELCDCVPSSPVQLYEATCSLAHVNYVVATQFSPVHNLVVSGCLDGKIVFHQPVL